MPRACLIPSWRGAEQAHVLQQASDAEAFHRTLLAAFMRAAFSADKQMRMAIVGGGATGVELSAGLRTSAGELPADLVVWAAGIKAAQGNRDFGLGVNRSNQFVVNAQLRTSAPSVYAMGDCAACAWRDGATVPTRAQAAHQQAQYLARALVAQQAGRDYASAFGCRDSAPWSRWASTGVLAI